MSKRWTQREEEYLLKKYSRQPTEVTAMRLNRSVNSVRSKAQRMGVGFFNEDIFATTIAKCFHTHLRVVSLWISKYDLPYKKANENVGQKYIIDVDDFWKWADKHRNLINWSKYETKSLLPEPDWVEGEIRAYKTPNTRKKFSKKEIATIRRMIIKDGLPYKEIAERVGRTVDSINSFARRY